MTRPGRTIALMLLPLLMLGCEPEEQQSAPATGESPLQTIYGYHTVETHMGEIQWEIFGEKAERFTGEEDLYLIGVRMIFYEEGEKSATLTSQRGRVNENTRNMTARGEVEILTEDERTLRSEVLHWDNEREIIHTAEYFRATEVDKVLTGVGLETDPKMTDLVILEEVEGDVPQSSASSGEGDER